MITPEVSVLRKAPLETGTLDQRMALVRRIIASEHLRRSPKLINFLLYVCERVAAGAPEDICEQMIGIEVFARKPGYDSNDDNIVRAHASRLRQKLEAYFHSEGRTESLHITLPRGGYVPLFTEVMDGMTEDQAPHNQKEDTSRVPNSTASGEAETLAIGKTTARVFKKGIPAASTIWGVLTGFCCILCLATTVLAIRWRPAERQNSASEQNHTFWSAVFQADQVLLVPGDSSLNIYNNATGKDLELANYLVGGYRSELAHDTTINPEELRRIATRRLTTIVDLRIVAKLAQRPELANRASVIYARDLRPSDLERGTVILLGSEEANPWVEIYREHLNFTLVPNQQTKVFEIINATPRPGEASRYVSDLATSGRLAYALISCIPNASGKGYVLMFQGTAMAGTEAAAEFALTNPTLSKLLSPHENERLPKFEILLQTSSLNGEAPGSRVLASRVY